MMKKFIRQNIDHQPIVDNVFKIVSLANDAIAKKGKENIVNATIGSLYDEDGKIVTYKDANGITQTCMVSNGEDGKFTIKTPYYTQDDIKNSPYTYYLKEVIPADATKDNAALEEMLKNLDSIEIPQANAEEKPVEEAEETPEQSAEEAALDLDHVLQNDMTVGSVLEQEHREENKGAEKRMDVKTASDENAIITAGMVITGDVSSEGSMDLVGTINGNIDILGKLNITGYINGNSKAAEIFAEGAKINGEIMSEGSVKIGASTVVIGNITATSAAIAGAVKGDIDVQGPVILDSSAIVMGNIKSKSVQINNGAVIEGFCSQCYSDVDVQSLFNGNAQKGNE